jgi:hypothetical protein
MENNIKEMRERHQKEIEDFQNNCLHIEVSDWIPYMWAPGHYGNDVKVCERCNKIMEEKKLDMSWVDLPGLGSGL